MNGRVLVPCLFLSTGFVVFDLACRTLSPYPDVPDEVYEAGPASLPSTTGATDGETDGPGTGDGFLGSDGSDGGEDTGGTVTVPGCPKGTTTFANANDPQTVTLDITNAYWTNGAANNDDGGASLGSIGYLPRASKSGQASTLVAGLTEPVFIANLAGQVAWTAQASVGLYDVKTMSQSTPGTSTGVGAGVAVDSANVYWLSTMAGGGIVVQSAPVGGGGAKILGTTTDTNLPRGLAVQGENLYFAGYASAKGGGAIYTMPTVGVAPTTLKTFTTGTPNDLVTDTDTIYWTDVEAGAILTMPIAGGAVTTLASSLGRPQHLAIDSSSVYTADYTGGGVYAIPIAGSGKAKLATAQYPTGVAADDNQNVVYFTTPGAICTVKKP
jgi:hypothetical protein